MALMLVIDDEPSMRRVIRRSLEGAGHTVLEAEDGRNGVRLFQAHRPVLVITDILMPEKEGIETIRELRATAPAPKILAISGGGQRAGLDFLRMAESLGADGILPKPFRKEDLLSAVARLVGTEP